MIAKKDSTFIYHADYERIIEHIKQGCKVLDLGCGTGELLYRLITEKNVHGRGVEINEQNILKCIGKGIPVFQGNIDEGLAEYQDQSYDYVILNQTLQVTHKPEFVLKEMLRVGKTVIVSFPNFGYLPIRLKMLFRGRMPITKTLPFEWYDTPNIRLLTIKDFRFFCELHDIKILREISITSRGGSLRFKAVANLAATEGLFFITKAAT
ncbi:MAG: methionine biosynthesis protein MetW [Candidatus Auribacterota bacterium]|jgi:methionine biosynthesis protein MetW|nr:methionine biosynthesis protein MetW [Candidatus Auribacterota bacterium]